MIQSVLFNRNRWTLGDAINWINKHGYKVKKIDAAPNYWRFRQFTPKKGAQYSTIRLNNGILLISSNI